MAKFRVAATYGVGETVYIQTFDVDATSPYQAETQLRTRVRAAFSNPPSGDLKIHSIEAL